MKRLIIENSSGVGSLVLANGQSMVLEQAFRGAAELAGALDAAVKTAGRLDEIVVGIGPGSYTGLRVGIATALGMKLALGCRTLGCPSVLGYPEQDYLVIGDARRGALFLAEIRDGMIAERPRLIPRAEIAVEIDRLNAARIFATTPIAELAEVNVIVPHARYLLNRDNGYQDLSEPLYLKEPHITRPN